MIATETGLANGSNQLTSYTYTFDKQGRVATQTLTINPNTSASYVGLKMEYSYY